jgi:Protein of unknown function (DUF3048) N-terminal domain/Protein of unknown function (DUF3048) C-terminal domain
MIFSSRAVRLGCVLGCVTVSVVTLAACSGHHAKKPAVTLTTSTPVSTPATTSAAPKPPAINPFTGGKPSVNRVVAVKIEDTAAGRPQVGVNHADVVYIEQVEGGLTRLVAVFNTTLPVVEPVRSTRANDPELLAQYGPIDYAASGGSHAELAPMDHSKLHTSINDRGGPGFMRDNSRGVPNNLKADLGVIGRALKGAYAKSIGLSFSPSITNTATLPGTAVRTVVGGTPVAFNWVSGSKRYARLIDGVYQHTASGSLISTPNVIVQFCKSTVYTADRDVLGNPAQYTHTIGSGKVVVFRNGRRIVGTWSRPSATAGTTLKDAKGQPIALAPGGEWFVLVAAGSRLG